MNLAAQCGFDGRSFRRRFLLPVAAPLTWMLVAATLAPAIGQEPEGTTPERVDFQTQIRPLLSDHCYQCHGPDENERQGGFRLDDEESAFGEADSGEHPIVAGDPETSELIRRITSDDESERMPPPDIHKDLTPEEIDLLRTWVEQGAEWNEHWAFVPPERPALPRVRQTDWPRGPLDYFVLERIEAEGLSPNAESDRANLLRRVSFDLTGLPPTLEELDAFLSDTSPNAYERAVDRLLASPRFGEHMARYWLDAARYGDTHGLHLDNYREMWPYRDWVVNAFNANKPYNVFATEQLAGDLLPDPTLDQLVATGFNRCHVTTNEGGSIKEEVYVRNVVDRVVTFGTVFMGMTFECTRCHDHKYDPFTMNEFYSLFAFFNSIDGEAMDGNKAEHPPIATVTRYADRRRLDALTARLAEVEQGQRARREEVAGSDTLAEWIRGREATLEQQPPQPPGLLFELGFDEAEGDAVPASLPVETQGTVVGNAKWTEGHSGNALDFDGQTYVEFAPEIADFERDQSFSYGAWVRPRQNGGGAVLSRMNDNNRHRGFDLYVTGGKVAVHLIHRWSDDAVKVTTKTPLKQDEWQHVFVTYDGSSKAAGVAVYFDGIRQEVDVNVDNLTGTMRTEVPLRIGARNPGALFNGSVDELQIYDRALTPEEVQHLAGSDPVRTILLVAEEERTDEQTALLLTHYLQHHDAPFLELQAVRDRLQQEKTTIEGRAGTTLIWKERNEPRPAFVLHRGEYDQPADEVARATPSVLPPFPEDLPRDRLGLATWMVQPRHPLTSRVAVNRFWQQLFGEGLVRTAEDFGSQGEPPSHPELLDWLAVEFEDSGWNVKQLMRTMVTSATYRQSSRVGPELLERDPDNRLLARGPRFRIDAESLRDQALAVSGLVVHQMGGPSVKPPQPDGLWFAVGYSGSNTVRFSADSGPDKVYRRTLYTFIKRTSPPPQMSIIDAPSREACVVRRERTNTPMQALLLLNDPQYVEAARALAERTMRESSGDATDDLARMFRRCTSRFPDEDESKLMLGLLREEMEAFAADPEAARELIAVGETVPDPSLPPEELAAWTVMANVVLNLDEVLNKN